MPKCGCGHTRSPHWKQRSPQAFCRTVLVPGVTSHVCYVPRPSCLRVTCWNVAVATAHLFGSSAPRWPSRPAGSQRGAMQCQPPVALQGLPALPLAVHVCRHQETGAELLLDRQAESKTEKIACALTCTKRKQTNYHAKIKSQGWTQAFGVAQAMNTPSGSPVRPRRLQDWGTCN